MSWLDDLEARLDNQLEAFLHTNPTQEALLAEQERRDREEHLRRLRLRLQEEAERGREALLELASEIRCWQERVEKARRAGADDLANRAEAHVSGLMEQGRQRWQALGELGQRFSAVEWELSELERRAGGNSPSAPPGRGSTRGSNAEATTGGDGDLGDAWAAFEAQQELEALRQRLNR